MHKAIIWGIVGLVLGAILLIISAIGYALIPGAINDGVIAGAITSKDDDGYDSWLKTSNSSRTKYEFYCWNLTNVAELYAGLEDKPVYQQSGPYTYYAGGSKFNVSFSDDGKTVTYNSWSDYEYYPSDDGLDAYSDLCYNLNPSWAGVIAQVGSETAFTIGAGASAIAEIRSNLISSDFSNAVFFNGAPQVLSQVYTAVVGAYGSSAAALNAWANQTTSFPGGLAAYNWWLLSYGSTASGISLSSAQALWNSSYPGSLVYPDPTLWENAALGNATALQIALASPPFLLNGAQIGAVIYWRLSNQQTNIQGAIMGQLAAYGVTVPSDLGYLQWATGVVLQGASIADYYPDLVPAVPEISIFAQRNGYTMLSTFDLATAKTVLDTLDSALNLGFAMGRAAVNVSTFLSPLTTAQSIDMLWYLEHCIFQQFIDPNFREVFITVATPDDLFFGHTDPLLVEIGAPTTWVPGAVTNWDINQEAAATPDTYYTGAANSDGKSTGTGPKTFDGSDSLSAYYPGQDFKVKGGDGGWIGPYQTSTDSPSDVLVFVSQIARDIKYTYDESTTIYDIEVMRYRPDTTYETVTAGTDWGNTRNWVLNEELLYGAPIWISLPAFYLADDSVSGKLTGVTPDQDTHGTYIDIEPVTGLALRGQAGLQASLYIPPAASSPYDRTSKNLTHDTFYPLWWVMTSSSASSDDADSFKSQIYSLLDLRDACIVFIVVGSGLIVAGVFGVVYGRKQNAGTGSDDNNEVGMSEVSTKNSGNSSSEKKGKKADKKESEEEEEESESESESEKKKKSGSESESESESEKSDKKSGSESEKSKSESESESESKSGSKSESD